MSLKTFTKIKKKLLEESIAFSVMYSIEQYFSAFALFLGISGSNLSKIFSFPRLFASIFQLATSELVNFAGSRKKAIIILESIQSLIWFCLIIIGIKYHNSTNLLLNSAQQIHQLNQIIFSLIILISIYYLINSSASIIWSVWVNKFIKIKERGAFFGLKNRLINLTLLLMLVSTGTLFNLLKHKTFFKINGELLSYIIVFGIAGLARIFGAKIISTIDEKESEKNNIKKGIIEDKINFHAIFNPKLHFKKEFIRFTIYGMLLFIGVFIAAPYFAQYMLKERQWSYLQFVSFTILSAIIKMIFSQVLGDISDEYGHAKILKYGLWLISTTILSWVIFQNYWMILFVEIFNNIGWATWDLLSTIMIYEYTTDKNRTVAFAWFNLMLGLGAFFGSLISGNIYNLFARLFRHKVYHAIFLTSALIRLIALILFQNQIKDIRTFKNSTHKEIIIKIMRLVPKYGSFNYSWLLKNKIRQNKAKDFKKKSFFLKL